MAAVLLACDWGTTNLRAWTLDAAGRVVAQKAFPGLGVAQVPQGQAARQFDQVVRPALGGEHLPAILCGMVGSTLGWLETPYVDCPAGLNELRSGLALAPGSGSTVRIAPGVRCRGFNGRGDVMRGEETQILGWVVQDVARAHGRRVVCLPGTHSKWCVLEDGRITAFATAMTGELFALLSRHGVLAGDAAADDMAAFDEGVAAAEDGSALAARLFTARARVVGFGADPAGGGSYLSGLLIGAEVAALPRLIDARREDELVLLGEPGLCGLYGRALATSSRPPAIFDGRAAAAAGLFALSQIGRP